MVALVPFVEASSVSRDIDEYDFADLAQRLRQRLQRDWRGPAISVKAYIVPGERMLVVGSVSLAYFIVDNLLREWTILR